MFLSNTEAAVRLGLGPARIRQLCVTGQLPGAAKVGRNWIIPAEALEHYGQHRRKPGWPAGRPRHPRLPDQLRQDDEGETGSNKIDPRRHADGSNDETEQGEYEQNELDGKHHTLQRLAGQPAGRPRSPSPPA